MAGQVKFNRDYAAFGAQVKAYEKADDVGIVVTEFLWFMGSPYYPIGALINAKIAGIWLGEGERPAGDVANIDLIFHMGGDYQDLFEIVLRSDAGALYGGYIVGGAVEVTDEIVAGHRVLYGVTDGFRDRYVFQPSSGHYEQEAMAADANRSTLAIRASLKAARRP